MGFKIMYKWHGYGLNTSQIRYRNPNVQEIVLSEQSNRQTVQNIVFKVVMSELEISRLSLRTLHLWTACISETIT